MTKQTLFVSIVCLLAVAVAAGSYSVASQGYKANLRVNLFPTMPSNDFAVVDGATVSIEYGYAAGFDKLTVDYPGEFDIQGEFDKQTGTLHLSGQAPISEYSIAISTVVFSTTSEDGNTRRITWTYGKNTYFMTSTEHFYTYVASQVAWDQAKNTCNERKYMNKLNGYLATITSEQEMYEVGYKTNFSAWLGGNGPLPDSSDAQTWKWTTGPEGRENSGTGLPFWEGLSMYKNGHIPANSNAFEQWYRFQPDSVLKNLTIVDSKYQGAAYWNDATNQEGVSGYICEFGGFDESATALTSAFTYAGTVDLTPECALFTTQNECKNKAVLGCSWSVSCQQTSCRRHTTEAACESDPDGQCNWNMNGNLGMCVTSPCAKYYNGDACSADPLCQWRTTPAGAKKCLVARCDAALSSSACASVTGCALRNRNCGSERGFNCDGLDVVYILDGTAPMTQPFGKHSQGFYGLTQGFIEAQQVLTGTKAGTSVSTTDVGMRVGFVQMAGDEALVTPSGTGTGHRLTGDRTEMVADLTWHQRRFRLQNFQNRPIQSALNKASDMFKDSTGRQKVLVIFSAGGIANAETARNSINLNTLLPNVKIVGVSLQAVPVATFASSQALVSLGLFTSTTTAITLENLKPAVIYGLCGTAQGTIGNLIRSDVPNLMCNNHADPTDCNGDKLCAWDPSTMTCQNSACLKLSSSDCAANDVCTVNDDLCVAKCPVTDRLQCGGKTVCQYNTAKSICEPKKCVSIPNEDGCIAESGCVWDPTQDSPCAPRACNHDNQDACIRDTANNCMWSPDGGADACFQSLCAGKNEASCGELTQCTWDASTNVCKVGYCGFHVNEKTCQADRKCGWNVNQAPAACGPMTCRILNRDAEPKTACDANPSCVWSLASQNGYADMCVKKTCDYITTSCGCAAMDGCVWREGQCRDSRFVQCKPTDVVFLVEATNNMNGAFGRHPNGFIGVTEVIRKWSRQAPLSKTVDAAGFRLGYVGYGANTPLVTAQGTGAGGGLTNNIETWAEPNQELDEIEKQEAESYATGAGTNVKINPGLQAALGMFKDNKDANRKRVLIVIGQSAITDGSDNLDYTISQLEDLNVQIFSTVIRRFSSITPAEQLAAEFLRPIASDPHQLHFLFTTIDNMQSILLDDFCDPSSNTGKALEIDRNDVLPCNWLGVNECNIQPSCNWNPNGTVTCPLPGQCPNLGCLSLPAALVAQGYTCGKCSLKNGAQFDCSHQGTGSVAKPGVCEKNPCSFKCESDCQSASGCRWSASSLRCEADICSDATTCKNGNGAKACTFVSSGIDGATTDTCRRSKCGLFRSSVSCKTFSVETDSGSAFPCEWDEETNPGLCIEKECPYLSNSKCTQNSKCETNALGACSTRECVYATSESCEADPDCFWNPFVTTNKCTRRSISCMVSSYSKYSHCSANCGPVSVKYKSRSIVQFPQDVQGAQSCKEVAATRCSSTVNRPPDCEDGDTKMIESRSCVSGSGWESSCTNYCNGKGDVLSCAMDISCEWKNSACVPKVVSGCNTLSQADCNSADICSWNPHFSFCEEVVKKCDKWSTPETCGAASKCNWHTGSDANDLAAQKGLKVQVLRPGQTNIFVFPLLKKSDSTATITGATVTIETNYVRGKDLLEMTYPTSINTQWLVQSGTLKLFGAATVEEYINTIRAVTFKTTSTKTSPRTVTWSFGNSTIFSTVSGHHYKAVSKNGVSFDAARSLCESSQLYGLNGYLATVTSAEENTIIATKLAADGWISGTDVTKSAWKISTGPEIGQTFWSGLSADEGGHTIGNSYANWAADQPTLSASPGGSHPYVEMSGLWSAKTADATGTSGYICEYGGLTTDQPNDFAIGGAMVIGVGGCVPTTCTWHVSADQCNMDTECLWTGNKCVEGCGQRSTYADCEAGNGNCKWDTDITPPVCDINKCKNLGETACGVSPLCQWSATTLCTYKSGCAQYTDSQSCGKKPQCSWTATTSTCGKKPCNVNSDSTSCAANPLCEWNGGVCSSIACKYSNNEECSADRECTWSDAVGGSGSFAPGGTRTLVFSGDSTQSPNIQNPIDGITIMIVDGFRQGQDVLTVDAADNIAGNYQISFNEMTGTLILKVSPGVSISAQSGYNFMKNFVKFYSSSTSLQRRTVAYSLGLNTVVTSVKTIFKYFPANAQNLEAASQFCASQKWFSLQGQLSNVVDQMDNLKLKALGAQGWIGAKLTISSSATWSWVPSTSSVQTTEFWKGAGAVGTPSPAGSFAQWAAGEPSAKATLGDGAYFASSGMWKAMTTSGLMQKGIICQFGDGRTHPPHVVYGKRSLMPQGCYKTPCLGISKTYCTANPQCIWRTESATCAQDPFCPQATTVSACNNREICFWDYTVGACRTAPSTACTALHTSASCAKDTKCEWFADVLSRNATRGSGACRFKGCLKNPTKDSCTANPVCRWNQPSGEPGSCVARLCGYPTASQCWADKHCIYTQTDGCGPSPCYTNAQSACSGECEWKSDICAYKRCSATDKDKCMSDPGCLFKGGACKQPACDVKTKSECESDKECFYDSTDPTNLCSVAQCSIIGTQNECTAAKTGAGVPECKWVASDNFCQELTSAERAAPGGSPGSCEKEVEPNLWWLWALLVVIFLLLVGIMYRLYLAYSKGLSFFEPKRNRKAFSPHEHYAEDLYDQAKETGVESNTQTGYNRPSLNDL